MKTNQECGGWRGGKAKTEREGCQHVKLEQHEPNMEQRQRWRDRGW